MVVLGYIHADTKRFHVYVANRVAQIRKASEPSSWHHVVGKENPADIASRGVRLVSQLLSSTWFTRPTFLHQQHLTLPSCIPIINPEDPEVKSSCLTTKTPQPSQHYSNASQVFKNLLALSQSCIDSFPSGKPKS